MLDLLLKWTSYQIVVTTSFQAPDDFNFGDNHAVCHCTLPPSEDRHGKNTIVWKWWNFSVRSNLIILLSENWPRRWNLTSHHKIAPNALSCSNSPKLTPKDPPGAPFGSKYESESGQMVLEKVKSVSDFQWHWTDFLHDLRPFAFSWLVDVLLCSAPWLMRVR